MLFARPMPKTYWWQLPRGAAAVVAAVEAVVVAAAAEVAVAAEVVVAVVAVVAVVEVVAAVVYRRRKDRISKTNFEYR